MSASLMRHQQFEKRRPIRLIAGILFFVLYGLYLIWRVTIFNADSVILSSLFYAMDFIGFFLGGAFDAHGLYRPTGLPRRTDS